MSNAITIQTTVNTPVSKVWEYFNNPEHVTKWNQASEDWECPKGTNDLQVGGEFVYTMAAKDGSVSFDFGGTYTDVKEFEKISYVMADGRKVDVTFKEVDGKTEIVETFDPETENSLEMQRAGWQSILDNFKKYSESQNQ